MTGWPLSILAIANFAFRQGHAYSELADNLLELGRLDQALEIVKRALEVTDQGAKDNPGVLEYQESRTKARIYNASILKQTGRRSEAIRAYLELVEIYEPIRSKDPVNQYNLARAHACLASLLAAGSGERSRAEADSVASHLDRAMGGVKSAVAAGYRRTAAMRSDPDLEPLHKRRDFQLFMMDLEFPDHVFTHWQGPARRQQARSNESGKTQ